MARRSEWFILMTSRHSIDTEQDRARVETLMNNDKLIEAYLT